MEVARMLKVRGTKITFNRGDDIYIKVDIYDSEGQTYTLREGDKLFFSVKRKETDKNYAIAPKELDYDVIHISPEDTYDLAFGTYVYDVQMVTAEGRSNTIIKPSVLTLEPAITAYGDR